MTNKPVPQPIILDTDMLTDCDDAGTMALMHTLADRGEVDILGVVLNGYDTHGFHSAVISAINTHYGRPSIPIGVSKRLIPSKKSSFSEQIWHEFLHDGLTDQDRPNAVSVYRELLVQADDQTVSIVSIGFLTNLEDLLRSSADAVDDRDGCALIQDKVRELVVMGGEYPLGKEHNFCYGGSAPATVYVIEHWPETVPIVFSGGEIGKQIRTGTGYQNQPNSPMRRAYQLAYDALQVGRPRWDQTALLYAARGAVFDGIVYWTLQDQGRNQIHKDGSNTWLAEGGANHAYLVEAMNPNMLAEVIEQLIIQSPINRN